MSATLGARGDFGETGGGKLDYIAANGLLHGASDKDWGASGLAGGADGHARSALSEVGSALHEGQPASDETRGAISADLPAKRATIMTKNAIKGIPALLGDARRALSLTQAELADLIGSSKRTVQRWETSRAHPYPADLTKVAGHVYKEDAELAAEIAATFGQTLVSLGIVAPPAPPPPLPPPQPAGPPPMPRHLAVDAVVCVASEALGALPGTVRGVLLAAFRRARELGLSCDEVEQALDEAVRLGSTPKGKREAAPA
jgi:DNA-binding transcriptional regulator YiaG